jgi:hypothetical protein
MPSHSQGWLAQDDRTTNMCYIDIPSNSIASVCCFYENSKSNSVNHFILREQQRGLGKTIN